jgi:hypothetical protein
VHLQGLHRFHLHPTKLSFRAARVFPAGQEHFDAGPRRLLTKLSRL